MDVDTTEQLNNIFLYIDDNSDRNFGLVSLRTRLDTFKDPQKSQSLILKTLVWTRDKQECIHARSHSRVRAWTHGFSLYITAY